MGPSRAAITPHLAERWCWQAAQRDEARVARRLDRTEVVDGGYRLDEGARLDDFCQVLRELGVLELMASVQGKALQRERGPVVQDLWRYGVKTWCGMERRQALPALWCSDEARRQWVGFKAQQGRHGVCQRGAATRQRPRTAGPRGPEPLANNLVQLNLRDLEVWFTGSSRARAQAGSCGAKVTGMIEATALEPTARSEGGGHVTRPRQVTDTRGPRHESEVTVDGWKPMGLIDAATKLPLAVPVGPIHAPAVRSRRALVTQARTNLAGATRLHTVVFARGCLEGVALGWLDQQGIPCVGPAKDHMAVTAAARAHAATGEGLPVGRRGHTIRHGQGRAAWTERRETEVVGITGLTTDDPYGPPAHGRHHHRRDFEANPIHAVVVRCWPGQDDGPGGNTVFLTNAAVPPPHPLHDDDDRRRLETCGLKAATPPGDLGHPPQNTGRAVRVHGLCTFLRCARATADRWRGEQAAVGAAPVGGQRWRRQLLEQTRDQIIVLAQRWYGLCHLAAFARLVGVKLNNVPPGIGTLQAALTQYGLTAEG